MRIFAIRSLVTSLVALAVEELAAARGLSSDLGWMSAPIGDVLLDDF